MNVDVLVLGILLSLLISELAGISPGGIVVPGYLALFFASPFRVAATFAAAFAAYGLYCLVSRRWILFGRRRFAAMILFGTLAALALQRLVPLLAVSAPDLRAVGYIVPGLLANSFERQGPAPTSALALAAGGAVYALALLLHAL